MSKEIEFDVVERCKLAHKRILLLETLVETMLKGLATGAPSREYAALGNEYVDKFNETFAEQIEADEGLDGDI